jgi:hypothetical protein
LIFREEIWEQTMGFACEPTEAFHSLPVLSSSSSRLLPGAKLMGLIVGPESQHWRKTATRLA